MTPEGLERRRCFYGRGFDSEGSERGFTGDFLGSGGFKMFCLKFLFIV